MRGQFGMRSGARDSPHGLAQLGGCSSSPLLSAMVALLWNHA